MPKQTENQRRILRELRDAGLWTIADASERAWKSGRRYYIDLRVPTPRGLRGRFMCANKEATANA